MDTNAFPAESAIIYRRVVVTSHELAQRNIGDGESPALVLVTHEASGFAVWAMCDFLGREIVSFEGNRETAIELAVSHKDAYRAEVLTAVKEVRS